MMPSPSLQAAPGAAGAAGAATEVGEAVVAAVALDAVAAATPTAVAASTPPVIAASGLPNIRGERSEREDPGRGNMRIAECLHRVKTRYRRGSGEATLGAQNQTQAALCRLPAEIPLNPL